MIISKTPYRISFFGGGTDYPVWYKKYGGSVLSTTIDKYIYISLRNLPPFFKHKYRIVWSHIETVKKINQIKHEAVREMLKKHMPFEKWWPWFWDNDKTVIVTKGEHRTQEYIYRFKKEIIEIDWREGYFKCQKTVGFHYTKKNEGMFIRGLAHLHNIKCKNYLYI